LIENDADIAFTDTKGSNGMHQVMNCFNHNPFLATSLSDYIISKGCDTQKKNIENWSPIHIACQKGQTEAIKYMIKSNFDFNLRGG